MAADTKADNLKALHATALEQFKFIAEVETAQRKSELEALRFEAGDQWPEEAKVSRAGLPANAATGTPAVPARPMLTMRTLDQPLAQISSMAASADLGIKIVPKDGNANKDTAEVIAGLVRSIEADSHAKDAYAWGFQRMRSCGRGYWRVNKTYANESGGFDQVIRIEPIQNGASVYLDPNPSWQTSGGFWEPEFGFITEDLSEAQYKRRYGSSKLTTMSDAEILSGLGDNTKHWVIEGDAGKYYRTAEYFYATYETTTEKEGTGADALSREVKTRRIMWAKMNGVEFLDAPQDWDGHYIPIIPVYGNKFDLGGRVVYEGMVQPAMSPCRMLNYMVSSAAEKIGLSTQAPWLVVAGQLQSFENWWNQSNVRNFPYLEYNAMTPGTGQNVLGPPTRNNDAPAIEAYDRMIGTFTGFIRSTTGVPDAALGHVNTNDKSGKAIEALKAASEQGSSNWLNYQASGIRHGGVVVLDMIPAVYDRPGRVERILGSDNTPQSVMLNAPFTRGQDGQPVPHQPSMFGRLKSMVGMGQQADVEHHNLSEGQYSVIVDVGKSQETRRQTAMTGMSALAQAAPELVPKFADLWVRSMDIPDADAIADRIKPPGVDDPNGLPPAAQAQIAQMQQVIQELQQAADDNQTKKAIAAHSDATKLQVADIQAQTTITAAEIKAGIEDMKAQIQVLSTLIGTAKEERLAQKAHEQAVTQDLHQAGHEVAHTLMQHQQAQELAAQQHQQNLEAAQQGHEQALEQSQMPKPIDPNAQQGAE